MQKQMESQKTGEMKSSSGFIKKVWDFKVKNVLPFAKEGAIIWVVNFIISEILISGGRYEKNAYVGVLYLIFAVALILMFNLKKPVDNFIKTLYRGASALITYAILDYLVVAWLLEKNSFAMYRFWGLITTYAVVLVLPILIYLAKNYISSRKVKLSPQKA